MQTDSLNRTIARATEALLHDQKPDGHWIYELETDAAITAQYLLYFHYFGETPDPILEQKLANYLRRTQLPTGGWALHTDGPMDIRPSTQAYFALKMAGDPPDAQHMTLARDAILRAGGAEAGNVFSRILFALFGIVTWDAVPMMPVEIILLPQWFPFHLSKMSYWARATIVPLLVLCAKRPLARNPRGVRIDEIFITPPSTVGLLPRRPHQSLGWFTFFRFADAFLRVLDPFSPKFLRQRAIDAAVKFVDERLNGEDGFGAAFPPILYSMIMYDVLGKHSSRDIARSALDKLLFNRIHEDEAYCQSVLSPVWDTVLAAQALLETRDQHALAAARRGLEWLRPRQVLDVHGDWAIQRPDLRPGGWAFFYACPHYPDADDTAVIVMAMQRCDPATFAEQIARGREWVVGMQSANGGWGAFDAENTHAYMNDIPFSDHGAMLDQPTADVTGRCLSMLAQLGESESEIARRAYGFLFKEQEKDGSWFGRWGVNYIYGTWVVLSALNAIGLAHSDSMIQRAVKWLLSIQNGDGGWGENPSSYRLDYAEWEPATSTASQTAWALLGLMAVGEVRHAGVAKGVAYLQRTQEDHGLWDEELYTGTGFPRVLYLRYHGYSKYFPLMALARYRNLMGDNSVTVPFGM